MVQTAPSIPQQLFQWWSPLQNGGLKGEAHSNERSITDLFFTGNVYAEMMERRYQMYDEKDGFSPPYTATGFPLDKAVAYSELRKPFVINDLDLQYHIQDRREVYRILKEEGILLPRYAVLNRDPDRPEECSLVEGEDHVEVNGEIFQKPFVEKPVSAEDHNVYIYYPTSAGGGSQRLFRKIGSRSSVYSPESNVRKTGSYIYEEFMPTDGTDVKVYTVGPDYAHAEARKSPALDGKVERDSEGKEVRYPVILNAREKLIAWKVCLAFKQTVCGFDLLRANGQSYVCDVNGFSFVKNSMKYYDDCAKILGFFDLFEKYEGYKTGKLKLKKPKQLQEVLDIARQLLVELGQNNDSEIEESKAKLEQLKTVLEMYGHFSGINRKVQLTYLPHGCPKTSSEEEDNRRDDPSLLLVLKWGGELTPAGRVQAEELGRAFRCMYPGGQGDYAGFPGCGLLRLHSTYRHDLKIYASDEGRVQMTAAAFAKGLLALEGELTPILVQMVKSANMNGLLDSEGDSLSSCQQRVKARLHEILQKDRDFTAEDYEKDERRACASSRPRGGVRPGSVGDHGWRAWKPSPVGAHGHRQVALRCRFITYGPRLRLEPGRDALEYQRRASASSRPSGGVRPDIQLYHSETLELMLRRWAKLEKDFKMKNGRYDISKIPDIYDCIKYDVQHNCALKLDHTMELYRLSKALADIVIPQEYGIAKAEKLDIAKGYCTPLIRKIRSDLQRTQDDDTVNKLHPVQPCPLPPDSGLDCWEAGPFIPHPEVFQVPDQLVLIAPPGGADKLSSVVAGSLQHPLVATPSPNRAAVVDSMSHGATGEIEERSTAIETAPKPPGEVLSENSSHARVARLHAEQKHAGIGFELYSMVPSICPLETLHNSLSLKQVDEFLASVAASSNETFLETPTSSPASSVSFGASSSRKSSLNTYTPAKILPSPFTQSMNKATSMGAIVIGEPCDTCSDISLSSTDQHSAPTSPANQEQEAESAQKL
ncbi:VIP2 kinase, partial [Polypterus senegalus]